MTLFLLISAIILIACVIGSKLSTRFGVPTLLFFIGLGMLFGSDGLFQIHFEDYSLAEKICSAALIFHHVLRWLWYKMENCSSYS